MAARVSNAEVKDVLDTNLTNDQIDAFIAIANRLVNSRLQSQISDTNILTDIELMLSCHLCSLRDQRLQSKKFGDMSARFQGQTGMHLESTFYGQTAIDLDSTGTLKDLGKKKATVKVISGS